MDNEYSQLQSEGHQSSSAKFPMGKEKESHLQRGREKAEKADNMVQLLSVFKELENGARTNQIAAQSNILGGDLETAAGNLRKAAEARTKGAFGLNATMDVNRGAEIYKQAADTNKNSAVAISSLEEAAWGYKDISRWEDAAECFKRIGKLFESEVNFGSIIIEREDLGLKAMEYYGKAACLPQIKDDSLIPSCKHKVAEIAVKLKKYDEAAAIYLVANKPADAFFFQLAKEDAASDSLKEYEESYPDFSKASDYDFLVRFVTAITKADYRAFKKVQNNFKSQTPVPMAGNHEAANLHNRICELESKVADLEARLSNLDTKYNAGKKERIALKAMLKAYRHVMEDEKMRLRGPGLSSGSKNEDENESDRSGDTHLYVTSSGSE